MYAKKSGKERWYYLVPTKKDSCYQIGMFISRAHLCSMPIFYICGLTGIINRDTFQACPKRHHTQHSRIGVLKQTTTNHRHRRVGLERRPVDLDFSNNMEYEIARISEPSFADTLDFLREYFLPTEPCAKALDLCPLGYK